MKIKEIIELLQQEDPEEEIHVEYWLSRYYNDVLENIKEENRIDAWNEAIDKISKASGKISLLEISETIADSLYEFINNEKDEEDA